MKIEKIKIEDIKPYENNAKLHPEEQIEQIKKSIEEFGNNDPIAIDKDNSIIEGHGRYLALKELGYTEVEVIRLDHLSEEQKNAYMLIHNQLTMNTGFDLEILADELSKIETIDMQAYDFDLENIELDNIEAEDDEYEIEIPEEPKSKIGEVYKLGNHILMCGDSTSAEDVLKLTDGEMMDLCITDPPYNVDYEGTAGKIENDNMADTDFYKFLYEFYCRMLDSLKAGGAFYIFHADSEGLNFRKALKDAGGTTRECLIWVKNSLVLGRQDYQWRHEPCLYGWKDGAGHYFVDDRSQTTVYEEDINVEEMKKGELVELCKELLANERAQTVIHENKPLRNDLHPTMKPVNLIGRLMKNSSKPKEKVIDLFGGSGSTLIACEQLNRTCYMMEYDPKYVDVIIDRWEKLTGEKAEQIRR